MSQKDMPTTSQGPQTGLSEPTAEELAVFRQILPYISTCLTMNHEINNALAGVIGYGEFLSMDAASLSASQASHVQKIMESAERIHQLVQKLAALKGELGEIVDLKELTARYESK